ncbi:alpha/beta fold hydrolase [Aquisalimonas lutea]|uniref:alpha/beta fold hydrolase n=1 Tax=Aquisalimonas lutea TaxID=1327750 RepID=UPI0025B3A651|nr:alpha/beta fold hydrolase [Aquisalimonas lutea]MDN3517115.1 alpha/beta fold hydrolase [Aquisalimonas lutea]
MTRHPLRRALVLMLLLCATAAPGRAEPPELAGLDGRFIREPVFDGDLLVYEGGRRDGPVVVLVHGIGTEASAAWRHVIPGLTDDFRVVAFDLPGFGRSSHGSQPYTPDCYVRVLDHVIAETAGDTPVHLLGHSLGGAVSLRYAGTHPERVERLLLSNVAGILHHSAYAEYLVPFATHSLTGGRIASAGPVDWLSGEVIRAITRRVPDPAMVVESAMLRSTALRGNPRVIAGFALALTDYSETLGRVQAPTSIFWGREDRIAPLRVGRVLADALPAAELTVFDDTGHAPMLERPDAFNRALRARLTGDPPDAGRPSAPEPGQRRAECNGTDGRVFQGAYASLTIRNCDNVTVRDASARIITVENSSVTIVNTFIEGDAVGLEASNSQVTLTTGRIRADVPVVAASATLNIAGTRLEGDTAVLRATGAGKSEVTFSVTPVTTRNGRHYLHALYAPAPGETL